MAQEYIDSAQVTEVLGMSEPRSREVYARRERVTPTRAMALLESRENVSLENRKVDEQWVKRYAEDMRQGRWMVTGDSIKVNPDGNLIDGQHRLWAVVETGIAIDTFVVYNVPDETLDRIDRGRSRTTAQHLQMHGYRDVHVLASAITYCMAWEELGRFNIGGSRHRQLTAQPEKYVAFLAEHPELPELIHRVGSRKFTTFAGSRSLYVALWHLFREVDEEDAERFMGALVTGAGLESGNPILALRNRLQALRLQGHGAGEPGFVGGLVVKAWGAWRKGRKLQNIRLSAQEAESLKIE